MVYDLLGGFFGGHKMSARSSACHMIKICMPTLQWNYLIVII